MKPTTTTTTPSPLRRSERNRNNSSPSRTKKHVSVKHLVLEDKNVNDVVKNMDSRTTRQINKDSHKESNTEDMLIPEDSNTGGGKIDEFFKETILHCKELIDDCILTSQDAKTKDTESRSSGSVKEGLENNMTLGSTVVPSNSTTHETSGIPERVQFDCHEEQTSQILSSRDLDSNESLIKKCVGNDKGVNLTPKRKSTAVDKHSDVSATLVDDDNCNLSVDADPAILVCNVVETSRPSKRIRGINKVDLPTSTSHDEKSCTRNKEEKLGDSVERPQGNNVETEKIRELQRNLHLSLKPEIEKLCEILCLPDNVKSMVRKFLQYTMNNFKICTEPVSILQAFQLSLCWTAASLLSHKLDTEASLICAKRHLNFTCKKDAVDEINTMLWDLKDNFLSLTGNSDVSCSPEASESSNRVHSNTYVTSSYVELTKNDISRNIKESENRKNQWRKLLHMQQENKHKLKKDFEIEMKAFSERYKLQLAAIQHFSARGRDTLGAIKSEYNERHAELKRQHGVRLQALETKQLEARKKFREALAPDELSNLVPLKEHETLQNAPILLPYELSEANCERATASELSRDEAVELCSKVRSTDYPENAAPLNSLSTEQISDGCLDGVVSSKPCSSSSPSNGRSATISRLNLPSSTQQVIKQVLPTITDGQIPDIVPENCHEETECQLTDHVVVNESATLDYQEIVHRTMTENTLFQEAPVSIPVGPIEPEEQVLVPPLSSVDSPPSPVHILPSLVESVTSDYEEVGHITTTENTLSQEAPVSMPVGPLEPQEQVQGPPLSCVESPHSPVRILPANQPNNVSMVMEPPQPVQQLPSSGFLSSNHDFSNLPLVTGAEDWAATNDDALSSPIPAVSTEVQNLAVEQPASNLEVDSSSHQVVPPVSNMVIESLVPSGGRAHSSDTRNISTHRVINNHPIQTPAQSALRSFSSFFYDSLGCELERLRKLTEQNLKKHDDVNLQLKCNFEKEIEELRKKYDIKMKEIDVEYQEAKKNYDIQFKTTYAHKILADTMKCNSDNWFSGAPRMHQGIRPSGAGNTQLSRQQNATRPALVANPSFRGPPATTFQNLHGSTSSQTVVPLPIQAPYYNRSGNFNSFSARLPHINSISSPSGSLQAGASPPPYRPLTSLPPSNLSGEMHASPPPLPPYRPPTSLTPSNLGGEMRAPPPHLSPYRPSSSVLASSLSGEIRAVPPHLQPYRPSTSVVPPCMPNQPAPTNSPASSVSLDQWLPRPMPTISHSRHGHETPVGLSTPNLPNMDTHINSNSKSSINITNTRPRRPDSTLNNPQIGTSSMPANSSREATPSEVVCLSDDD